MKNIPKFKIRCSAIGDIISDSGMISEAQLLKLDGLQNKPKARTELQEKEMQRLIWLRENPQISQGAKTYCEKWVKEHLYNSRKEFTSKYTDKGNIMEDESIDFITDQLNLGFLIKNEVRKSDEWMEGEADVLPNELVIDAKNSWDHETFPLFANVPPDDNNYWQIQGYMNLWNRPNGKVVYTLMNTPEHLILGEAKRYCWNQGYEELDNDIYLEFHNNMTYDDIEDALKIKVFDIERNDDDIQKIKDRVEMCRDYIAELIKQI